MTHHAKSELVLTQQQAEHIDRINAYHFSCVKSFGDQMGYAFLCGAHMNALKEITPHGQLKLIKETQFKGIPPTSLDRYRDFAKGVQSKNPTVGFLNTDKLLTNGELPEKEREKVLAAVHEFADGKTLTQLYRDLGVIRTPKKSEGKKVIAPSADDPDDSDFVVEVTNDMLLLADAKDTSLESLSAAALAKFQRAHRLLGERIKSILVRRKSKK